MLYVPPSEARAGTAVCPCFNRWYITNPSLQTIKKILGTKQKMEIKHKPYQRKAWKCKCSGISQGQHQNKLHTKNQLPGLPGSALTNNEPITLSIPTQVEVEFGCDSYWGGIRNKRKYMGASRKVCTFVFQYFSALTMTFTHFPTAQQGAVF